jgi:hypothetical protein
MLRQEQGPIQRQNTTADPCGITPKVQITKVQITKMQTTKMKARLWFGRSQGAEADFSAALLTKS